MSSKAKKGGKPSPGDEEAFVLDFLTAQNRPFSVQNMVDALQKTGVKKAGTDRALASLVAKGTVTRKEYGKVSVYILAQDKIELPDQEEVERVDTQIKDLTAEAAMLDTEIASVQESVARLQGIVTVEAAQTELETLDKEIDEREKKLESLGDGSSLMSKEEKSKIELAYFKLLTAWKKRKRVVRTIADTIGENSGMKPIEFYAEVGIETDEEIPIDIASFPVITNPTKTIRAGVTAKPPVKKPRIK